MCKNCYCNALNLGCASICDSEVPINYFATQVNETIEFRVSGPAGSRSQLSHLVMGQQLYFSLEGLNEYAQHVLKLYNHDTGAPMVFQIGASLYDALLITTGEQTVLVATGELTLSDEVLTC